MSLYYFSRWLRKETAGVVYWVHSSQEWEAFTFLPDDVVLITTSEPINFLEDAGEFISDERFWHEDEWQWYLDSMRSVLDLGSIDDVVSGVNDSLVFHFDGNEPRQYTISKAGERTLT